jgi:hypothetical protein
MGRLEFASVIERAYFNRHSKRRPAVTTLVDGSIEAQTFKKVSQ